MLLRHVAAQGASRGSPYPSGSSATRCLHPCAGCHRRRSRPRSRATRAPAITTSAINHFTAKPPRLSITVTHGWRGGRPLPLAPCSVESKPVAQRPVCAVGIDGAVEHRTQFPTGDDRWRWPTVARSSSRTDPLRVPSGSERSGPCDPDPGSRITVTSSPPRNQDGRCGSARAAGAPPSRPRWP